MGAGVGPLHHPVMEQQARELAKGEEGQDGGRNSPSPNISIILLIALCCIISKQDRAPDELKYFPRAWRCSYCDTSSTGFIQFVPVKHLPPEDFLWEALPFEEAGDKNKKRKKLNDQNYIGNDLAPVLTPGLSKPVFSNLRGRTHTQTKKIGRMKVSLSNPATF